MFKWPVLMEDGRKAGHTYSRPDLIIAATALHHGLAIVSRYTTDFASQQPVGLKHLICGYGIFAAALGG